MLPIGQITDSTAESVIRNNYVYQPDVIRLPIRQITDRTALSVIRNSELNDVTKRADDKQYLQLYKINVCY